ncbi:hypothetical protein BGZ92_002705 [Podila epicladia]|nr:hypothetical protein BGZ92_002705 [Podila epicladia]
MARLNIIRRAMDLDGQRYREINRECHHMRTKMERLRAERDRAEERRARAEGGRDNFRADNKHYRDVNRKLSDYNEKMLTDYNKLNQRYKSLEARQSSEHPLKEIPHAEKVRPSLTEESMAMRSLQDRKNTAQESNTFVHNEALNMTTAKDAFVAHLQLSEDRADSPAKQLLQIKTELDEKTNDPHGNRGQSSVISAEELPGVKEDMHQGPRDIAEKKKENLNLSTQLIVMERAIQQQEDKIAQLTRELEQAKRREIHSQGSVQHNDIHGIIRTLEEKVQTLQSLLQHTTLALRNSEEVIKMMREKQGRSANPTQVIQNLEQLKADIEREQARQSHMVSMKAILEYRKQFGYQPREEEFEMKVKEIEITLKETRDRYERVITHWKEYPAHERALVKAAASISQWRQDVEFSMSTSVHGRDSRAAR